MELMEGAVEAYFVLLVFMSSHGTAMDKVGVYPTKASCVAEAKEAGLMPNNSSRASSKPSYACIKAYYPMEDKD